jgi:hypothetical protein
MIAGVDVNIKITGEDDNIKIAGVARNTTNNNNTNTSSYQVVQLLKARQLIYIFLLPAKNFIARALLQIGFLCLLSSVPPSSEPPFLRALCLPSSVPPLLFAFHPL